MAQQIAQARWVCLGEAVPEDCVLRILCCCGFLLPSHHIPHNLWVVWKLQGGFQPLTWAMSLSPTILVRLNFLKHCYWGRLMIQPPLLERITMKKMLFFFFSKAGLVIRWWLIPWTHFLPSDSWYDLIKAWLMNRCAPWWLKVERDDWFYLKF